MGWFPDPCFLNYMMAYSLRVKSPCGSGDPHSRKRWVGMTREGHRTSCALVGRWPSPGAYGMGGRGTWGVRQVWDMTPHSGSHSRLVRAGPGKGLHPGLRQALRPCGPHHLSARVAGAGNSALRASFLNCKWLGGFLPGL